MPSGGRRVGAAGRNYTNRSDLRESPRKPSTPKVAPAATNTAFGAQADQLRSLQALPLAPASTSTSSASNGTGAAPLIPTDVAAIDRPTQRPDEPVTTGIASGPGAGPEVLPPAPLGPDSTANDFITALARRSNSPELAFLADYVTSGRA